MSNLDSECPKGNEDPEVEKEEGECEASHLPEGQEEAKNESREQNKVAESDEDVPGDFFDDFLKEDFMAGLDIVDDDEWDEDKIKINLGDVEKPEKNAESTVKLDKQIGNERKRKKLKSFSKQESLKEKEKRGRQKKKRIENDAKPKRKLDKPIDADDFDIRRDPEKTKRDIERDKVRCEKDKEMKIITEKLNLVETGLVPPGMEMEIDIEEVKRQKEKIENKSPRDLREHIRDLKEKNKSPIHRARSPVRRRSPIRRSLSPRRPNPIMRSIASPLRNPRRSPMKISPRRRSSERIYPRRRSRSHSPYYRNRRLRHRERSNSRESDREKWLKRRKRSRSPRRKRDGKKSFLQEIAEKLNEIHREPAPVLPILQPMQPTLHYVQPQPMPVPVPAPAPVPAPIAGPVFPDPYDQSFFIGTPNYPQIPLNPVSPHITPNGLAPSSLTNAEHMQNHPSGGISENQEDITKVMLGMAPFSEFIIMFVVF